MSQYAGAFSAQSPQYFYCYIQDDKLMTWGSDGVKQVGVSLKAHEELEQTRASLYDTCQEYYNKLIEAGIIKPEPTPEDIARQQAEIISSLKSQVEQGQEAQAKLMEGQRLLMEKIEAMTGGNNESDGNRSEPGPVKNKKSATEGKRADNGA